MQKGLSLMEMLIVLAVIGILAGIVYPGYSEQLRRSARGEAVGLLHTAALSLQRHHARNGQYTDTLHGSAPLPEPGRYYRVQAQREADAYRLLAIPLAGGAMEQDACGAFALDHTGARSNPGSTEEPRQCWPG